jgi:hypothetical protein
VVPCTLGKDLATGVAYASSDRIISFPGNPSMANLHKLEQELLGDGRITKDEVGRIREQIESDGQLDYDDVIFLVNLVAKAKDVCEEFDELFFPAMRQILLADGVIGMDEQYQLLRMLYSDGNVRPVEKEFLKDLYKSVDQITPEFRELCDTALKAPATNWDIGGCQS